MVEQNARTEFASVTLRRLVDPVRGPDVHKCGDGGLLQKGMFAMFIDGQMVRELLYICRCWKWYGVRGEGKSC